MNDDIVTRLQALDNDPMWWFTISYNDVLGAIDEIERLRAELAHAQTEIARLERLATNG